MKAAIIALGANVPPHNGEIKNTLQLAIDYLRSEPAIGDVRRSRWFRTPAFPPGSGPDFVNAAARLETDLDPPALLERLHAVEAKLGRTRTNRWEPRVCDIDLLSVGDEILPDRETVERWMALDLGEAQTIMPPHLILPHPRMHERAFVLVPLADIAPDWRHPMTGQGIGALVAAVPPEDVAEVVPLEDTPPGG